MDKIAETIATGGNVMSAGTNGDTHHTVVPPPYQQPTVTSNGWTYQQTNESTVNTLVSIHVYIHVLFLICAKVRMYTVLQLYIHVHVCVHYWEKYYIIYRSDGLWDSYELWIKCTW